jgi:hypothetical protein
VKLVPAKAGNGNPETYKILDSAFIGRFIYIFAFNQGDGRKTKVRKEALLK